MKSVTKFIICGAIATAAFSVEAVAQCEGYLYYPTDQVLGWTSSDYNLLINLDAAKLTDAKYPRTGAEDGKSDNLDYGTNTLKAPTGDGAITVPLYDYDTASGSYVESGKTYDIKYVRCVFAPDHYGSAYTKLEDYGETPSGKNDVCTINDNTCLIGNVYGKQGFIELSRQSAPEGEPVNSLCGYIQLDNLLGVDKVQWSWSTTSWKRGVICDVKWEPEGDFEPLRVIPSGVERYATFAEQGYELEESIGFAQFDTETPISIRFRIYDSDTLTFADQYDLDPSERTTDYYYHPVAPALQAVRIHQIKVYSALQGSEYPDLGTGINNTNANNSIVVKKVLNEVIASEECLMEIYSIDGKQVEQKYGTKVDISGLSKGIYVVKATAGNKVVKNIKIAI